MAEMQQPGYWAVIPAVIRRDDQLPANAKLLYGDLSALTNEAGYCYASNEYLMGLYGWSDRTVQRLISALEDRGYIRVEQVQGIERRIYCGIQLGARTPDKAVGRPPTKLSGEGRQKCRGTPDKIVGLIKENKTVNIYTPLTPQEKKRDKIKMDDDARALLSTYVGEDRELSEALDALMEVRTEKKAVNSGRAINALLNKLNKLSAGNRDMKLQLIQESLINGWKSVFPLKGGDRLSSPPARREVIPID